MFPYTRYRSLLNICRYSSSHGRPFLPRSRRTSSTVAASRITRTSRSPGHRSPAPLRPADGFPVLPGGALLPRLLRDLRHHRARAPKVIPRSSSLYVIARLRCPTHLLESLHWGSLLRPGGYPADPNTTG